ncbi:MAG TPA: RHS repeat-associated core domain-containing protein, partial [Polyangiaceae bacterium LLY-WYZ-15_(1-7)]|nr:RHS repeat-associated core domain-containing protein [Polyangiaceae bacterium LLY-WYZ-15_(1-7)]
PAGDDTTCNGRDEDCDGRIDEHGSGTELSCNGRDDDCDGAIDEAYVAPETHCGEGVCASEGQLLCVDGDYVQTCEPGPKWQEEDTVCDGIDGDCDGRQDHEEEAFENQPDNDCDGVDDNCNGSIDEGFVDDGNPCTTGDRCVAGEVVAETIVSATCPADPYPSAPVGPPGGVASFADSVAFLHEGPGAYQRGVTPGTIDPARATRLYGEVHALTDGPMGGVRVSIVGHPEFGHAYTRADGKWDLVVNGGGGAHVSFQRDGHPEVQRTVTLPHNDHVRVPTVVMTPYDDAATTVTLDGSASAPTVHTASQITDEDGTRTARLLFPSGVSGEMTLPDGSIVPLASATVRATELTVGALGPQAMPGSMPCQIMYTYAVELSLDEAVSAGATRVDFDRALPFYLDNFLGFPVGAAVPTGWYDRLEGAWKADRDGRVIEVFFDGSIDIDGDGSPESIPELDAFGIDAEERGVLATRYPASTLWRVPIRHFTPWDHNWPGVPTPDAEEPPELAAEPGPEDAPCERAGSLIQCENRTVAEELPILGTNLGLRYQSDRVPGHEELRHMRFVLTDDGPDGPPESRLRTQMKIEVAGRAFYFTGAHAQPDPDDPNRRLVDFEWDGLDWRGQPVTRPVPARVEVCHVYPAVPAPRAIVRNVTSVGGSASFGQRGVISMQRPEIDRSNSTARLCRTLITERVFGSYDARAEQQLGGLTLTAQHAVAEGGAMLLRGDGTQYTRAGGLRVDTIIASRAGGEVLQPSGTDARDACMTSIRAMAVDPAGRPVVVIDAGGCPSGQTGVFRLEVDGTLTRVAGDGSYFIRPDGHPADDGALATEVPLHRTIRDVAFGPDGSLYIAEQHWIRRVDPDGRIHTLAGVGRAAVDDRATEEEAREGLPAVDTNVRPTKLSVMADGTVVFVDALYGRIRAILPDGRLETWVGGGQPQPADPDTGTPEMPAPMLDPDLFVEGTDPRAVVLDANDIGTVAVISACDIAFDLDGRILRLSADGLLYSVTGSAPDPSAGHGAPAQSLSRGGVISDMEVDASGRLVFVRVDRSSGEATIWRIEPDDRLSLLAGGGAVDAFFDSIPADQARVLSFGDSRGLALGPEGNVYGIFYLQDTEAGERRYHVARVRGRDLFLEERLIIDGAQAHQFDADGRHIRTLDAITGEPLLELDYDAEGRLSRLTDADGNVVDVAYPSDALVTFTPPFGPATLVRLHASGELAGWVNDVAYSGDPDGARSIFELRPDGLLDAYVDRRGQRHEMSYDELGRLEGDLATGSGYAWSISQEDERTSTYVRRTVRLETNGGRAVEHEVLARRDGRRERRVRQVNDPADPSDDLESVAIETYEAGALSELVTTSPDGTSVERRYSPDPLLGWGASHVAEGEVRLPSGRRNAVATDVQAIPRSDTDWRARERVVTTTRNAHLPEGDARRFVGESRWVRAADGSATFEALSAGGRRSLTRLDADGRPVWSALVDESGAPLFHPTVTRYDGRGRVTAVIQAPTDAAGEPILSDPSQVRRIDYAYTGAGGADLGWLQSWSQPASDGETRAASFGYDPLGRVDSLSQGGATTELGYDVMGHVDAVTPPGRDPHRMSYSQGEALERYEPPAYTDASSGASVETPTRWAPGADRGELARVERPDGRDLFPHYDEHTGRIQRVDVTDLGSLTYGYVPPGGGPDTGQLRSATMPQASGLIVSAITNRYDYDGPLLTEEETDFGGFGWSVAFEHDSNEDLRLRRIRVDGSTHAEYAYDADGLLTEAGPLALTPNPETGMLERAEVGEVATTISRTAFGEPDLVDTSWPGGRLAFDYDFDRAGRIVERTETTTGSEALRFAYDARGRLTDVFVGASTSPRYHYEYDENGNRVAWQLPWDVCASDCADVDEQDRLLRAGSVRYAYDDAGQLERRIEGGAVTEYEYDALGHLRRVQLPSGEVISYLVDARGRRVARLVDGAFDRLWAYQDGLNPIAEFDGTGKLTKRFIYGTLPHVPDLIVLEPAGTVLRVVTDQVGSVRRVVDVDTGQVMQSLDYSPFGVIENETRASGFDQPFRFAGGLHDRATGLIRFGARDYDPHLGRWTAKDPIGFAGAQANLYEYALSRPIDYVDIDGRIPWFIVAGLAAAVTTFAFGVMNDLVSNRTPDYGRHAINAVTAGVVTGTVGYFLPAAVGGTAGASLGAKEAGQRLMGAAAVGAMGGLVAGGLSEHVGSVDLEQADGAKAPLPVRYPEHYETFGFGGRFGICRPDVGYPDPMEPRPLPWWVSSSKYRFDNPTPR